MAFVLGSYVGERYDRTGKEHGDPLNECLGPDCFAPSFGAIAGLSACGIVGSVVLWMRTKGLYASMVGRLLEAEAEAGFVDGSSD
jgi:hypothetical protein